MGFSWRFCLKLKVASGIFCGLNQIEIFSLMQGENKMKVNTSNPTPIIYRINDAIRQMGISRGTLYKLVKSGDLTLVKIGERASGITAESIIRHLEKNRVSLSKCVWALFSRNGVILWRLEDFSIQWPAMCFALWGREKSGNINMYI